MKRAVYLPAGYIPETERQPLLLQDSMSSDRHPLLISEQTLYNSRTESSLEIAPVQSLTCHLIVRRTVAIVICVSIFAAGLIAKGVLDSALSVVHASNATIFNFTSYYNATIYE